MKNGDRIIYTAHNLGAIEYEWATRFHERVIHAGEEGQYIAPHENPVLAEDDWHMTLVKHGEGALFVPVHSSQFKAAPTTKGLQSLLP